jgi:3-oxoacyl-[acyl-carrier-protein] synthase II
MADSDVVITGLGMVSPLGMGHQPFWDKLLDGQSAIRKLTEFHCDGTTLDIGAPVADFDPKEHVRPRKAIKVMCREIQVAFAAAQLACNEAGIEPGSVDPDRMGVVFGSEILLAELSDIEPPMRLCRTSDGRVDPSKWGSISIDNTFPLWMLKFLPNMAACHVAIAIDARGPNNSITLEECSSLAAISEAVQTIRRGHADIMLAGGGGTRVSPIRMLRAQSMALAAHADPIDQSVRPWDIHRTGMRGGEGAVFFVLESRSSALRRGKTPIASIAGWGNRFVVSGDGHQGSSKACSLAIDAALQHSGIGPRDIVAATGHAIGDVNVDQAMANAFGQSSVTCPVTSIHGTIGHTGAACGAFDLAVSTLAIKYQQLPATRNCVALDPACKIDVVRAQARTVHGDHALSVSMNLAGHAIAMVVKSP